MPYSFTTSFHHFFIPLGQSFWNWCQEQFSYLRSLFQLKKQDSEKSNSTEDSTQEDNTQKIERLNEYLRFLNERIKSLDQNATQPPYLLIKDIFRSSSGDKNLNPEEIMKMSDMNNNHYKRISDEIKKLFREIKIFNAKEILMIIKLDLPESNEESNEMTESILLKILKKKNESELKCLLSMLEINQQYYKISYENNNSNTLFNFFTCPAAAIFFYDGNMTEEDKRLLQRGLSKPLPNALIYMMNKNLINKALEKETDMQEDTPNTPNQQNTPARQQTAFSLDQTYLFVLNILDNKLVSQTVWIVNYLHSAIQSAQSGIQSIGQSVVNQFFGIYATIGAVPPTQTNHQSTDYTPSNIT